MISLIVSTRNRLAELDRLLTSLEVQSYKEFEVLIVDQNSDGRLVPLVNRRSALKIRHLRSQPGVSVGRNAGLQLFDGDLVAFPDDDCWYSDRLLQDVVAWFSTHTEFDGLVTGLRNERNQLLVPKFAPQRGRCTKKSIIQCGTTNNIFMRRHVAMQVGFFRADMGPGAPTPYQSGDDLDYLIRMVENNFGVWYEPELTVYHPDFNAEERLRRTTYSYAQSVGRVWRLHNFPWYWCLGQIVFRSLGGAVLSLCKGDFVRSYDYLVRAAGQFLGYWRRPITMRALAQHAGVDGR